MIGIRSSIVILGTVSLIGIGAAIVYAKQLNEFITWVKAVDSFNKGAFIDLDDAYALRNENAFWNPIKYAINNLDRAIELAPNFGEAYYLRGQNHANLENYQKALEYYNKALQANTKYAMDANFYLRRGSTSMALKDYKRAIADLNRSIKINPDNPLSYFNRGSTSMALKDYKRAIADLDRAITINPKDEDYHFNRALTRYALKDYKGAIIDLDRAIEIEPNNDISWRTADIRAK